MKIVTIHGSARADGSNAFALGVVQDELKKMGVEVIEIHPSKMALDMPFTGPSEDKFKLQEFIKSADGVVLNTPEYHGSYSSLIKMTIENMGFPSALLKKPVSLLGVAGGAMGAVKSLEHLASICRHTGAIIMPKNVSVANGDKVFDKEGICLDENIEHRLRLLAKELVEYIQETTCPKISFEQVVREDAL